MQKSIKELKADLWEYEQEHALGGIGDEEFEKAKASLNNQIKNRGLIKCKVAVGAMLDTLKDIGDIDQKGYANAIRQVTEAKSTKELKGFIFKTAE